MKDEMTGLEVAALMRCDPGFVRRLRIDGRLPGLRQVGITWTYSRKAVKDFLRTWDRRPGSYDRNRKAKPRAAKKKVAAKRRRAVA